MWEKEDFDKTLEVLREGGVIIYPTDTVWGIGCDATNDKAVSRIYEIKKRIDSKSMLTLVDVPGRISSYVKEVPDIAWELIDLSEKPITIIYPEAKNLASNLLGEDSSVGIRVVNDDFCKKLVGRLRKPIVSTSANISGEEHPSCYHDISEDLLKEVDYVVSYKREFSENISPSSIIKIGVGGEVSVIRK